MGVIREKYIIDRSGKETAIILPISALLLKHQILATNAIMV